jgi:hypothetical protein
MIESEFITLDKVVKKARLIWNFLEDIPCWIKPLSTIYIHCNSHLAIRMT